MIALKYTLIWLVASQGVANASFITQDSEFDISESRTYLADVNHFGHRDQIVGTQMQVFDQFDPSLGILKGVTIDYSFLAGAFYTINFSDDATFGDPVPDVQGAVYHHWQFGITDPTTTNPATGPGTETVLWRDPYHPPPIDPNNPPPIEQAAAALAASRRQHWTSCSDTADFIGLDSGCTVSGGQASSNPGEPRIAGSYGLPADLLEPFIGEGTVELFPNIILEIVSIPGCFDTAQQEFSGCSHINGGRVENLDIPAWQMINEITQVEGFWNPWEPELDSDEVVDLRLLTALAMGDLTLRYEFGPIPVITDPPNAVPLPAAAWLFGTALIGLLGFGRRRKTA